MNTPITIHVTVEDIAKAEALRGKSSLVIKTCPIAQAVQRHFGSPEWTAGYSTVRHPKGLVYYTNGEKYVCAFDARRPLLPFVLELYSELPQE